MSAETNMKSLDCPVSYKYKKCLYDTLLENNCEEIFFTVPFLGSLFCKWDTVSRREWNSEK